MTGSFAPRVAFLLLGLLAGAQEGRASSPESVLARMRARQSTLSTMKARIEQTKTYPQLGIEDPVERGLFWLRRDGKGETSLRLEIREPDARILVVAGGRYLLYQPRLRQAIEGEASGRGPRGLFSGVLGGSPEALDGLERDYEIVSSSEGERSGRTVYELRFAAKEGAEVYCWELELSVDLELWVPVRQRCREANGSVITFSLSEVELDVELEEDAFEIDVPEGVERIEG